MDGMPFHGRIPVGFSDKVANAYCPLFLAGKTLPQTPVERVKACQRRLGTAGPAVRPRGLQYNRHFG